MRYAGGGRYIRGGRYAGDGRWVNAIEFVTLADGGECVYRLMLLLSA